MYSTHDDLLIAQHAHPRIWQLMLHRNDASVCASYSGRTCNHVLLLLSLVRGQASFHS